MPAVLINQADKTHYLHISMSKRAVAQTRIPLSRSLKRFLFIKLGEAEE
jgi:hypothetical protein